MTIKLLYFGPQWPGSTSLQRLHAFQCLDGVQAFGVDNGALVSSKASLLHRVRWKLRLPVDVREENWRLRQAVRQHRPDIVVVDNSKVIRRSLLARLREFGARTLVYYSPDDLTARHNLSLPLKWSLPDWDLVCTTKTFNVAELKALGVSRPCLVGKAYDSDLHRPMQEKDVGTEFERFDAVFVGTYEQQRCASINALAEAGVSTVVYGADKGGWQRGHLRNDIELRNSVFGKEYVAAWHTGKVALCFLRKINRDRITQRTMEIAAIGRPMLAERTDEHDAHFHDGEEYLGFASDGELVTRTLALLRKERERARMACAARQRCLDSGYSTHDRAVEMLAAFTGATEP